MPNYLAAAKKAKTPEARRKFTRLHREQQARERIAACTACPLADTRTLTVPWDGPTAAKIALVGEAPGKDEDRSGAPFVGRAGKLLDHCLSKAGLERSEVMVFNTLACRPPDNRDPSPTELQACRKHFDAQLNLSQAVVTVLMGRSAYVNVTGNSKAKMGDVQGVPIWYEGRVWLPTYHPAFILRQRSYMGVLTADLRQAKAIAEGHRWPEMVAEELPLGNTEVEAKRLKRLLREQRYAVMVSRTLGEKVVVLAHEDAPYPHRYGLLPVYTLEELAKVGEFGRRAGLTRDMVLKAHLVKSTFGGQIVA